MEHVVSASCWRDFDRLIENYIVYHGVNPDRVYLLGYSAGGDGVYRLAPRMADRWAAASMMAGHPGESQPDNLYNIGFGLFMGGKDSAYDRNVIAEKWKGYLADLQSSEPLGYNHLVKIYPDKPHWMGGLDREAIPWMAEFERDPWPKKIIWRQDGVFRSGFIGSKCLLSQELWRRKHMNRELLQLLRVRQYA